MLHEFFERRLSGPSTWTTRAPDGNPDQVRSKFVRLVAAALRPPPFTDAWGTKHPGSANPGLTCCAPNFGSRIDYIFINSGSMASLDQVELAFTTPYGGVPLSDHRGLFARFTAK